MSDPGDQNVHPEQDDGENLNMFNQPPPPPTGPKAEVYHRDDGRPAAFYQFWTSDEGVAYWHALVHAALEAWRRGEKRFSARTFLSGYRANHKVRINDHFSPWFADELVAQYPELVDIIERRKRKKATA